MTKINSEDVDIDGFDIGITDFPTRLQQSPEQQKFIDNVISPLVATMVSVAETAVLLIIGHSDRVDDEGPTREQRRARELEASEKRTQSAKAEVGRLVDADLAARGLTVEEQMKARVQVFVIPSGAAQLADPRDVLSLPDRLKNRRVHFAMVRFVP